MFMFFVVSFVSSNLSSLPHFQIFVNNFFIFLKVFIFNLLLFLSSSYILSLSFSFVKNFFTFIFCRFLFLTSDLNSLSLCHPFVNTFFDFFDFIFQRLQNALIFSEHLYFPYNILYVIYPYNFYIFYLFNLFHRSKRNNAFFKSQFCSFLYSLHSHAYCPDLT